MRLGRNPANPLCEGLGLPDSLAAADGLVEDFGVARPGPGVAHRPHEGVVRESTQGRAGRGPCWPPPRPVNMGELLPNDSFVCLGRCSAVSIRSWCFHLAPSFASAGFSASSV